MKKNKNNKAQKLEKTDLVEGINNLIEEKAKKEYLEYKNQFVKESVAI